MVTISEAYFDESYQDQGPRILCVAGYVFRKSRSIEFGKRWHRYLRRKGLPYFHANECAHRRGVFRDRTDTDEISRKLISLAKEYSDFAVAVALDQDHYLEVCGTNKMFPSPYAYALTNCLYQIAHWRIRNNKICPAAFYFEQGHKHENDAHQFLNFMLRSDDLPVRIGYRTHAFVSKETPQVQPGDLLAWLWRLHAYRVATKDPRPIRRDLLALQRPTDQFLFFDRAMIERFRDAIEGDVQDIESYARSLAASLDLSEEEVEVLSTWRPDYRTTKF